MVNRLPTTTRPLNFDDLTNGCFNLSPKTKQNREQKVLTYKYPCQEDLLGFNTSLTAQFIWFKVQCLNVSGGAKGSLFAQEPSK